MALLPKPPKTSTMSSYPYSEKKLAKTKHKIRIDLKLRKERVDYSLE